jgi:hypothetical protein
MAKAFSVASWNVEHFKSQGVSSRVEDVVELLAEQRPDVFALYEVEGKEVFDALTTLMPRVHLPHHGGAAGAADPPRRPDAHHGVLHAEPSSGPASRCFARARC